MNLPSFRASMMDGYAVVSTHGVGPFVISGRIAAGNGSDVIPTDGSQVVYITTGAIVPDVYDAIIPIESTEILPNGTVQFLAEGKRGQFIRDVGSDVAIGTVLVEAGTVLTAAEIGLLAAVGIQNVPVVLKPRVGIASTGDELIATTEPSPTNGKIYDCNRPMLLAAVTSAGCEAVDLGIWADNKDTLRTQLQAAMDVVDVVITTGGVSMVSYLIYIIF